MPWRQVAFIAVCRTEAGTLAHPRKVSRCPTCRSERRPWQSDLRAAGQYNQPRNFSNYENEEAHTIARSTGWNCRVVDNAVLCHARRRGIDVERGAPVGASKWTGAGHSAVYLSGVCAASPWSCASASRVKTASSSQLSPVWRRPLLRVECNSAEYLLYGVEDESARTLYATSTVRWMLQERYRERYLENMCSGICATNPMLTAET